METTAPAEFLSELGDINACIPVVLDCPRKSGWHWPTFYLLYVEVDRLAMLVMRVGYVFDEPILATDEPSLADIASDARSLLGMIDKRKKTIVGLLAQMVRNTCPTTAAQQAHYGRVVAHIHPKSGWYQTLMREQLACELDQGGRILVRTALSTAPDLSSERIDFMTAECLQRHQRFDIGSSLARQQLAVAARTVERRLGAVLRPMGEYLLEHCRIKDLMHPSSR